MPIYSARPDQVENALKHVYDTALNKLKGKVLDLLISILPDNNGLLYGALKRICETDLGLISQCCLTKHVLKLSKQYLANVSLKINVKESEVKGKPRVGTGRKGSYFLVHVDGRLIVVATVRKQKAPLVFITFFVNW
ncbi:hypothetical protein MKX03_021969 [Papaver bracteatum]|nr:hypothetical protein MKX03_021969 [Papaver bracteatum]